jgi:hypothetical protein
LEAEKISISKFSHSSGGEEAEEPMAGHYATSKYKNMSCE